MYREPNPEATVSFLMDEISRLSDNLRAANRDRDNIYDQLVRNHTAEKLDPYILATIIVFGMVLTAFVILCVLGLVE